MERSLDYARDDRWGARDDKVEPNKQKGGIYVKERNSEVDAADHSVGNHGRTHGTGSNLVHGYVAKNNPQPFRLGIMYSIRLKSADYVKQ